MVNKIYVALFSFVLFMFFSPTVQNKYNGTGIIISHMELAKSFASFVHEMQA